MSDEALSREIAARFQKRHDEIILDALYARGAFAPIDPKFAANMQRAGFSWNPFTKDWVRI